MPSLLADFIYSRDCKLNLRKNVDTTLRVRTEHDFNDDEQQICLSNLDPKYTLALGDKRFKRYQARWCCFRNRFPYFLSQ